MKGAENPIPSEFFDVRALVVDENKFRVDPQSIAGFQDTQLNVPAVIQHISVGYRSYERADTKIVVTSYVLCGSIKVQSDVTTSPSNFGNCVGRLFVIADTQYRTMPGIVPGYCDLDSVFNASSPTEALHAVERQEGGRYVVLSREPIDIPMQACAVSIINEVPAYDSLPRFEADCVDTQITDVNNERQPYSTTGGALYDPEAKKYLNVGAHYNLDVSQQDKDPTGVGVLYPRTNVANVAPPLWAGTQPTQVVFMPAPTYIDPSRPFQSIFDRADIVGYPRDELPRLATGALTFPKYVHPALNIGSTITYTTITGNKLIDLEIDFPDGIFVEYDKNGYPDVEIFAILVVTGGLYRISFNTQTALYFTDDDAWGVNRNIRAGTQNIDELPPMPYGGRSPSPPVARRANRRRERDEDIYVPPKRKRSFSNYNKRQT